MLKLLSRLKKSWKTVLIVVILLVFQAMAELELPNYTSKIVNIGIQQNGIDSCVPEAVREETMKTILVAIGIKTGLSGSWFSLSFKILRFLSNK